MKYLMTLLLLYMGCTKSDLETVVLPAENIKDHKEEIFATGRIRSANRAYISIKNGGTLDSVHVKEGDEVKADQILAVIDKETRTANLQRALSNFKLAKAENNRIQRLMRNSSTTQSEADKAEANLSVQEAELKVRKEELKDAVIRSPIDGHLAYFAFNVRDVVPDGSRLAVIEDRNTLEVRLKIPYDRVEKVVGEREVSVASYSLTTRLASEKSEKIPAKITKLSLASDYDSAYGEVRVLFLSKPSFNVGDLVQVKLYEKTHADLWAVSSEAVFSRNEKYFVLLQGPDHNYSIQAVEIIDNRGSKALVRGLPDNQEVLSPKKGLTWSAILRHKDIAPLL